MTTDAQSVLVRARELVMPALRAAVEGIDDPRMRAVAGYHFGWVDAAGQPANASAGKAIRPALAVLSAQAAGCHPQVGVPAAVAVELVHNFSLLHDDIMDRDVERRHRPTGWVVFGDGQAILAGNAILTAGIDALVRDGSPGLRSLPCLLDTVQKLISGQSADLALETQPSATVDDVLGMEAGKTAALLACAASIGAVAADADARVIGELAAFGHEVGMAFQLVDDILGITGDSNVTGKSSSSDVRAAKRSAPIVAALRSGTPSGDRLAAMFALGPPASESDVTLAAKLIDEAGGLEWAAGEAERRLASGLAHLRAADIPVEVGAGFEALASYIVERDR